MSEKDRSGGMGTSRITEDLRRREKQRQEILEGTETEYREVPPEEIRALFSVQDEIDHFLEAHSENNSPLLLPVIEGLLNAFPVWKAKFTTGDYGKSRSELIIDSDRDSVYYVTPSGFSLRLKKEALYDPEMRKEGKNTLAHVIQPFADLIVFHPSGERYDFKRDPGIGLVVREFFTTALDDVITQRRNGAFSSPLELYVDAQGLRDVGCPPELRSGTHDGHYVNKIIFER